MFKNNLCKSNTNTFEYINKKFGNKILYFRKRQRLRSGEGVEWRELLNATVIHSWKE